MARTLAFIGTRSYNLPTVTTSGITNITISGATGGATITGSGILSRGLVYGTNPTPTLSDNVIVSGSGSGSFNENITGLTSDTTYYVRAYVNSYLGVVYGSEESFSTTAIDMTMEYRNWTNTTGLTWSEVTLSNSNSGDYLIVGKVFAFRMANPTAGVIYTYDAYIYDSYRNVKGALNTSTAGQTFTYPSGGVLNTPLETPTDSENGYWVDLTISNDSDSTTVTFSLDCLREINIESMSIDGVLLPTSETSGDSHNLTLSFPAWSISNWTKSTYSEFRFFQSDPPGDSWDSGWDGNAQTSHTWAATGLKYINGQAKNLAGTTSIVNQELTIT